MNTISRGKNKSRKNFFQASGAETPEADKEIDRAFKRGRTLRGGRSGDGHGSVFGEARWFDRKPLPGFCARPCSQKVSGWVLNSWRLFLSAS